MALASGTRAALVPGDTLGDILAIAWIASEIAVDTFGMFFWAALVLFGLGAC